MKVRKKKGDGKIPTTGRELKELYEKIKTREPLTLREFLIDEGKDPALVDRLLKDLDVDKEIMMEEDDNNDKKTALMGVVKI